MQPIFKKMILTTSMVFSSLSFAQWPEKPIKLVVPYPPGGSVDIIARQYADYLTGVFQQNVLIENKPGAGTNIGVQSAIQSKADGYTLLLGTDALASNPSIGPIPPFNALQDLAPISNIAQIPSLIAASNQWAQNSTSEKFLERARQNPGHVSVGSASLTLQIATIEKGTRTSFNHITYKGGAPATADAVGGQTNAVLASIPVLHPFVSTQKLTPIATTGTQRSRSLPQVPTLQELGYPDAVIYSWYAVFAPQGTPQAVIDKVNQATQAFVQEPSIKPKLEAVGYELQASTPQALAQLLADNTAKHQRFAKENTHYFAQAK